jgi:hypothetical protein
MKIEEGTAGEAQSNHYKRYIDTYIVATGDMNNLTLSAVYEIIQKIGEEDAKKQETSDDSNKPEVSSLDYILAKLESEMNVRKPAFALARYRYTKQGGDEHLDIIATMDSSVFLQRGNSLEGIALSGSKTGGRFAYTSIPLQQNDRVIITSGTIGQERRNFLKMSKNRKAKEAAKKMCDSLTYKPSRVLVIDAGEDAGKVKPYEGIITAAKQAVEFLSYNSVKAIISRNMSIPGLDYNDLKSRARKAMQVMPVLNYGNISKVAKQGLALAASVVLFAGICAVYKKIITHSDHRQEDASALVYAAPKDAKAKSIPAVARIDNLQSPESLDAAVQDLLNVPEIKYSGVSADPAPINLVQKVKVRPVTVDLTGLEEFFELDNQIRKYPRSAPAQAKLNAAAPEAQNPKPNATQPEQATVTELRTYKVQEGDSFWKIARREYGLASNSEIAAKVQELVALNIARYPKLARNPDMLHIGQELSLPYVLVATPKKEDYESNPANTNPNEPKKGASVAPTAPSNIDGLMQNYRHASFKEGYGDIRDSFDNHAREIASFYAIHGEADTLDTYAMLNDDPRILNQTLNHAYNLGERRKTDTSKLTEEEMRTVKNAYIIFKNKTALEQIEQNLGMQISEKTMYRILDRYAQISGENIRKNPKLK